MLLLLKAQVRAHSRRGPRGQIVAVRPYRTRTGPAAPGQGDLFAPRAAPPPPPAPARAALAADDPVAAEAEGLTGRTCFYCGGPERLAIHEIWADHNFMLDTCCPGLLEQVSRDMADDPAYATELLRRLGAEDLTGQELRRVPVTDEGGGWPVLDYQLQVSPISRGEANAFIARWHRHNPPLPADVFRAAVWNGSTLLGVVMVGAPTARAYMPQFQRREMIEVRRLCIRTDLPRELTWRAASTLYRHAADEAQRRGYGSIISYTLASEDGMSLRYARWRPEATIRGKTWNTPSRPRQDRAPTEDKVRWIKRLTPTTSAAA